MPRKTIGTPISAFGGHPLNQCHVTDLHARSTPPDCDRPAPVRTQTARLSALVEENRKAVTALADRLTAVLTPQPPCDEAGVLTGVSAATCPLADELSALASRVEDATHTIQRLLSRLEV